MEDIPSKNLFGTHKFIYHLVKEHDQSLKVIEDLKIQVALLVHTRSSNSGTEESKETQTESSMGSDKQATSRGHNGTKPKRNYSCYKCDEFFDDNGE